MTAQPHPSHHLLARVAALEEKIKQLVTQTEFDILRVKVQENLLVCEKHHLHANVGDKGNVISVEKLRNNALEERITELTQKLAEEEKQRRELEVKYHVEREKRADFEARLENSLKMYQEMEEKYMDLEKKYNQMEGRTSPAEVNGVSSSQVDASFAPESWLGATALPVQEVDVSEIYQEAAGIVQKEPARDAQLIAYAQIGNEEGLKSLIASGADVNVEDNIGRTALHYAAQQGYRRSCDYLILMGASVHARDNNNNTPLHEASSKGHLHTVQLLISHGASGKARNVDKRSPLHCAAGAGNVSVCDFLLDRGARLNSRDCNMATPLLLASWCGHVSLVELLLRRGAQVDAPDSNDRTPLHQAAFRGHDLVCEKLLQAEASINVTDINGNTPLHSAVMKGHLTIVKMLVQYGADTELFGGRNQFTPLELAEHYGRSDIADWLINHTIECD